MDIHAKLAILADAAKYDASCASSGGQRRDSQGGRGMGSNEGVGICHSYAPDGRCISLLKILLTNFCRYDCLYCVNRVTSNVPRARFATDEVVQLTLDFYRRNLIEGLFLSSGIIQSPDYTMEQVVEVARSLREDHDFRGYIHLKTIPDAAPELLARAGRFADRLSINIELPTPEGLRALAPEKDGAAIKRSMARLRVHIDDARAERAQAAGAPVASLAGKPPRRAEPAPFAAAGQSTQMIVGADAADDATILSTSAQLYAGFRLKRVYYSAFSPIPDASLALPPQAPPLAREHRLYQADWLMRFYGFEASEIASSAQGGMLSLQVRSGSMIDQPARGPKRRIPVTALPEAAAAPQDITNLAELKAATMACRRCPIGECATQSVCGAGPSGPRLMFVGEQPGDQEDLRGQPFVGPSGQLLDRALAQIGIAREQVFVTNAVKHFKFELRGKRRIHKTPTQREADACLHWLETEIALVRPAALVALGATAARSLLQRPVSVMASRGQWVAREDGLRVLLTLHPSALLRGPQEEREAAFEAWLADLRLAANAL